VNSRKTIRNCSACADHGRKIGQPISRQRRIITKRNQMLSGKIARMATMPSP
jgi:hypothetical protein